MDIWMGEQQKLLKTASFKGMKNQVAGLAQW
jgi:hypothetical protein